MEQHLQSILDLIIADSNLSEEEKAVIISRLNEADKKMSIDAFRIERGESLKKTMSVLLEETIEELEQKRKAVEEKNRELEIEASLERVRTVAMGMRAANDLLKICQVLFEELTALGFAELRNAMINVVNDEKGSFLNYDFQSDRGGTVTYFQYDSHPVMERQVEMTRSASDAFFEHILTGDDLEDFKAFRVKNGEAPDAKLENIQALYYYFYSIGVGSVGISTFSSLTEEKRDMLKRFRNVFDLAYRRYTDIQLAEAQAREAQIELALERVRARTMAMQRSEELAETAFILFQQFKELGENPDQATIGIINEDEWVIEYWVTMYGSQINKVFKFSIDEPNVTRRIYEAWKARERSLVIDLSGKELYDFTTYRANMGGAKYNPDEKRRVINVAFFSKGLINVQSSEERSAESIRLLERFAGVFDGTYTRFLDLKKAEAQARESQIELALERVRARTMAMQKSDELKEIIKVVYEQLIHLNILAEHAGFIMDYQVNDDMRIWLTDKHFAPSYVTIPYFDSPHWNSFKEAKAKGADFFANLLTFEEKNKFYRDLFDLVPGVTDEAREYYLNCPGLAISTVLLDNVGLYIENFSDILYTDEENATLMRFGKVFQQTYTRFLDLQKAEAQVREAKIEAALERTRTQSMIMQHSSELDDTLRVFHEQVLHLNIDSAFSFLWLPDEEKDRHIFWAVWAENDSKTFKSKAIDYALDRSEPATAQCLIDWKGNDPVVAYHVLPEGVEGYFVAWQELIEGVEQLKPEYFSGGLYYVEAFMKYGCFGIMVKNELPEQQKKILARFAIEFERTYTRFLDLQKAEEQAREAKIEASLERVRSKTMAMHNSQDIADTMITLFDELLKLGVDKDVRCGVNVFDDEMMGEVWTASFDSNGNTTLTKGRINMTIHPLLSGIYKAWQNKEQHTSQELSGKDVKKYFKALMASPEYPFKYKISELPKKQVNNAFFFPEGCLFAFTAEQLSEEAAKLFKRFAGVFGLTYRRYLDLKLAEEQAREATIEASLERVRGKAMAMHNSADLTSTASMVFTELGKLGINPIRCGVGLLNKDSRKALLYSATTSKDNDALALIGWVVLTGHHVLTKIYDSWLEHENYFPILNGKQLKSYYEILLSGLAVPSMPDWQRGEKQYGHFLQFPEGCLYAWADKSYSYSELKILDRFKAIISLTFKRYIELQKSEASACEAIRQASLDRVRAEIASMRSIDDLDRITPLIWNELTVLGIPFIRCGVFIVDEHEELIHTHLSTSDGKALASFNLQFDSEGIGQNVLPAWRNKQIATIHWTKAEFAAYTANLVNQGAVTSKERYVTEHPDTSLDLHFLPFLQGMLYVGNTAPLTDDHMNLVQSLADAFSTAYARYEDFNKLEAAKQQVENTLTDLKAAQTKLIQSEKMASLGELTAGIAHEIQNPLNFVNNFSDVSIELVDEMLEELNKGDKEEVIAISEDIKQNLEKIRHHGKRADGIVKGMLQHSRTSGGDKQPTNINTLADEFLRLSYHGLRAKDKTFNAELVTHFDPDLPKINVIGQDIGRVMLNLFNNAFYAVNQKKKTTTLDYKPEVSVTTSTENGQVIISVRDNGIGMPEHIKEKIMQPFFTTKPTGEGTGLGLSLTYDMVVKGHGGTIAVESTEGQGSEFIIKLPIL